MRKIDRIMRGYTVFVAFFVIAALLAVGSLAYTAKVYNECDGQVVKNMFDIPVCVERG